MSPKHKRCIIGTLTTGVGLTIAAVGISILLSKPVVNQDKTPVIESSANDN